MKLVVFLEMYESHTHENFTLPPCARQNYATISFFQPCTRVGKGTVGKGLFAFEKIFEGERIMEFKGERITTRESGPREGEYRSRDGRRSTFFPLQSMISVYAWKCTEIQRIMRITAPSQIENWSPTLCMVQDSLLFLLLRSQKYRAAGIWHSTTPGPPTRSNSSLLANAALVLVRDTCTIL